MKKVSGDIDADDDGGDDGGQGPSHIIVLMLMI